MGFLSHWYLTWNPKAVNISDFIKIEFEKRWTTCAGEARTKSNVNGRRLILRSWTKSRMTKPVSFTIPERQLEIVSSGPILAILTVNTPCSCCVLSCCPLSSSGMVIVNNMGSCGQHLHYLLSLWLVSRCATWRVKNNIYHQMSGTLKIISCPVAQHFRA